MEIDGINTKRYNAEQLTVQFETPDPATGYTIAKGQLLPQVERTEEKMGRCIVTLLCKGENRNEITRNISTILGLLDKPVKLALDGYKGEYVGILTGSKEEKAKNPKRYKLVLTLDGYMQDTPVLIRFGQTTAGTIHREGSRRVPAKLILTPQADMAEASIKGFGKYPIVVKGLQANHTVIIDGNTGLITMDGKDKSADVTIWEAPAIKEAETRLEWSSELLKVDVSYAPAWL